MTWFVFYLSLSTALASLAASLVFAGMFWNTRRPKNVDLSFVPSVCVIVSVRGSDPFLLQTLQGWIRQDYSNFRVVVVVDHHLDPSWEVVRRFCDSQDDHRLLQLDELRDHSGQRGLKCSALIQAVQSTEAEIVMTIDSDAIPDSQWIRNQVQPLQDPAVGATTGNQWFEPSGYRLGTWIRSVWHAGAIVPTTVLGNPWAGAFAMRRTDLAESGLMREWESSIIDDGPVRQCLHRLGKRLVVVPENISLNREDCSSRFSLNYVARMLTWSRMFESTFWITVLHMVVLIGVHILAGALLVNEFLGSWDAKAQPRWLPAISLCGLLAAQWLGYFIVRATVMSHHSVSTGPGDWLLRGLMVFLTLPLTLFSYAQGAIRAIFTTEIVWRQIKYRLKSGGKVEMGQYRPFCHDNTKDLESV